MMELRNRSMTCLVTLPDSVVLAVDVDRNSDGMEVLTKVCANLGILEVDFFGLLYYGSKGEELWLNLRNRLTAELCGSPPYRLHLCVKFFVEPHFIQQEVTRQQFFLNAKQQFLSGKLRFMPENEIFNLAALLVLIHQIECSKPSKSILTSATDNEQFLPPGYQSDTCRNLAMVQCAKLGMLGEEAAKGRFLKAASSSLFFGIHLHEARDDGGKVIRVGVGHDGITEYGEEWKLSKSWTWSAVQSATHNALCVILNTIQDDGSTVMHSLKLSNKSAANALYRDMTEMHSFYHCDTIGSLVTEQYCRDLKGTIISFFDENTCLGKRYVFDIQHTLREAYDYIRRILYTAETRSCPASPVDEDSLASVINSSSVFPLPESHLSCSSACQAAKQLSDIRDSLACHICIDADINTAFVPCGHVVCCTACAKRLDCCPICKCTIDLVQPVFLPYTRPVFANDNLVICK